MQSATRLRQPVSGNGEEATTKITSTSFNAQKAKQAWGFLFDFRPFARVRRLDMNAINHNGKELEIDA
jgi:hypothetical protein